MFSSKVTKILKNRFLFLLSAGGALALMASCSTMSPNKSKVETVSASQTSLKPSAKIVAGAKRFSKDRHGMPTYTSHSQRTRLVRTTAYSHMEKEVGAPGRKNAIGTTLQYGKVRSAAADWSVYPVGTTFRIKGQPYLYVVDDFGSALVGTNTIDIFKPSLSLMRRWGTRRVEITVVRWGSMQRSAKLLRTRRGYSHCRRMYAGCMRKLKGASSDLVRNGGL